jgi:hypothetical protein
MAISLLTSLTAASTLTDCPTCATGSQDTTGATLIVIGVCSYDFAARYTGNFPQSSFVNNFSVSDGNTYTPLTVYEDSSLHSGVQLYYCDNPNTSTTHYFRAGAGGTGCYPCLWVWVFTGTNTSGSFDAESGNTNSSTPVSIQPSAAVGSNGEALCTIVCDNLDAGTTQACDSAFIQTFTEFSGGNATGTYGFNAQNSAAAGAYHIASGSQQPTWSGLNGAGGDSAAVAIASFKAAGAAGKTFFLIPN